ncbi:MAG: hypothetical protein ACOY3P_06275 [Planctomycetota bacterium]
MLIILDVAHIMHTPYSRLQGWEKKAAFSFAEGSTLLPTEAECIVLAGDIDFAAHRPRWEISVMQLGRFWDDARLIRASRGYLDPIGETAAAWSPFDAYLVKLGLMRVGAYRPADRQQVARWARQRRTQPLAFFLEESQQAWNARPTAAMIAADFEGLLEPAAIERRAARLGVTTQYRIDPQRLTYFLASLRGARLEISFDPKPMAELVVAFGESAEWAQTFAQPLVVEVLRVAGRRTEDAEKWTPRVAGNEIRLAGEASPELLRRVFEVVSLDPPLDLPAGGEALPMAEATLRQFRIVQVYLNDLKMAARSSKLEEIGGWAGQYADRLDRMPVENIDDEFLNYRGDVSSLLRKIAEAGQYGEASVKMGHFDPQKDAQEIISRTVRVRASLIGRYGEQFE